MVYAPLDPLSQVDPKRQESAERWEKMNKRRKEHLETGKVGPQAAWEQSVISILWGVLGFLRFF